MFGLLFNSAMLTREKMKLQQTTDFAALVAADVQHYNLNKIREINTTIEVEYQITRALLQPPFCDVVISSCATFANCVLPWVTGFTGTNYLSCQDACSDWDALVRRQLIDAYQFTRDAQASHIAAILTDANKKAFDRVLDTFLTPRNLPHQLRRLLESKLGGLTPQLLKAEYQSGSLQNHLIVDDRYRDTALFIGDKEDRLFQYTRYAYLDYLDTFMVQHCAYSTWGPFGVSLSRAKVVRETNYTTNYLAMATYFPPNTAVDKKFALYLKNPDPKGRETDPYLRDMRGGGKVPLFTIEDPVTGQTKVPLITMALAKPYGGTFPTPGNVLNPFDYGEIGDEFKGAKLIGIANREELENYDLKVPKITRNLDYVREDFLH